MYCKKDCFTATFSLTFYENKKKVYSKVWHLELKHNQMYVYCKKDCFTATFSLTFYENKKSIFKSMALRTKTQSDVCVL